VGENLKEKEVLLPGNRAKGRATGKREDKEAGCIAKRVTDRDRQKRRPERV